MNTKTKMDFVQLAKEITRSDDINVVLEAAKKLQNYIEHEDYGDEGEYCLPENAIDFIEQSKVWSPAGFIPLSLYEYQKAWVEWLSEPMPTPSPHILIAARQMGLTTVLPLFSLWIAASKPWTRCVIVTPRFAMSGDIRDRLSMAIETMGLPVKSQNKAKFVLENGSEIDLVGSSTIGSGGGFKDANLLVLMDAAYYSYAHDDRFMHWTQRQISLGAQVIVGSCSSYSKGFLYDLVRKYPSMSTPWNVHPDGDKRADQYRLALSPVKFAMEMECQFITKQDSE